MRRGSENLKPEVLLSHQGAQMDARRSVREPAFDADVNVLGRTVCPLRKRAEHGRGEVRL